MLLFAGTLIWYHTHKHIHTTHSGGVNRLTHPYNYILTNTNCYVLKAAICIILGHSISTELEPKPPWWPLQIFMKLLTFDLSFKYEKTWNFSFLSPTVSKKRILIVLGDFFTSCPILKKLHFQSEVICFKIPFRWRWSLTNSFKWQTENFVIEPHLPLWAMEMSKN